MSSKNFRVQITHESGFRFRADTGRPGVPPIVLDEPAPLGAGEGPAPSELLAAAVGGCLTASLRFCLEKARVSDAPISAVVEGELERNPEGRLRIARLRVSLDPGLEGEDAQRARRCLGLFQDFCLVSKSVERGIPIDIEIAEPAEAPA